jgi:hypothetical protein
LENSCARRPMGIRGHKMRLVCATIIAFADRLSDEQSQDLAS